jgi:large subunit ribosomal protein L9
VSIPVTVNVARSPDEAERQARGEQVGREAEDEAAAEIIASLGAGAENAPPA